MFPLSVEEAADMIFALIKARLRYSFDFNMYFPYNRDYMKAGTVMFTKKEIFSIPKYYVILELH